MVPQDQSIEDIGSALEDIMTGKTIDYLYTVSNVQFDVVDGTQDITNAPDSLQTSYGNWTGLDLDGNVNATFDFGDTGTLRGLGSKAFKSTLSLLR